MKRENRESFFIVQFTCIKTEPNSGMPMELSLLENHLLPREPIKKSIAPPITCKISNKGEI